MADCTAECPAWHHAELVTADELDSQRVMALAVAQIRADAD